MSIILTNMKSALRTIRLRIPYYGQKVINGVSTYKVGHGARLLEEQKWRVVKRRARSSYTYMLPAVGVTLARGEALAIVVAVPDRATIESLAMDCHALGIKIRTTVGGWPISNEPRELGVWRATVYGLDGENQEEIPYDKPACFRIGILDEVWSMCCRWDDGDDRPPHWLHIWGGIR